MEFDFDKLKEQASIVGETLLKTANDVADKGKTQVQLIDAQNKLAKAQRSLGSLVYSLTKSGEYQQPLVDKYIEEIDEIEKTIEDLRGKAPITQETVQQASEAVQDAVKSAAASIDGAVKDVTAAVRERTAADAAVDAEAEVPAEDETPAQPQETPAAPATKICPQCGAEVSAEELFCNQCGAQL